MYQAAPKYYVTTENLYACSTAIQHYSCYSVQLYMHSLTLPSHLCPFIALPFLSLCFFIPSFLPHTFKKAQFSTVCHRQRPATAAVPATTVSGFKKNQGTALKFGRAV